MKFIKENFDRSTDLERRIANYRANSHKIISESLDPKLVELAKKYGVQVEEFNDNIRVLGKNSNINSFYKEYLKFTGLDSDDPSPELDEDVKKLPNGKWANVGKDGKADSGKFKTKKEADAQRKAMFTNGYKGESLEEKTEDSLHPEYVSYQGKKMRVQGIRPDGKYALSEPKYSGLDITNHPEYLIDVDKDEVEALGECVVNESYLREASHIIPKEFKRKVLIVEDEASIECVLSTVINTTSNTLNGGSEERSVGFRTITDSIPASFAVSFFDEDKQKEFYESIPKKFDSVKQFIDYLVDIYNSYPRTSAPYNIRNIAKDLGYNDEIETLEECVHSEIEEGEECLTEDVEIEIETKDEPKVEVEDSDEHSIKNVPDMPQTDCKMTIATLLNPLIKDELEAIDGYNSTVATIRSMMEDETTDKSIDYEGIIAVISEITNEENLHIGQLEKLLETVSPNAKSIDDGKDEATEQLEETSDNEEEVEVEESTEKEETKVED